MRKQHILAHKFNEVDLSEQIDSLFEDGLLPPDVVEELDKFKYVINFHGNQFMESQDPRLHYTEKIKRASLDAKYFSLNSTTGLFTLAMSGCLDHKVVDDILDTDLLIGSGISGPSRLSLMQYRYGSELLFAIRKYEIIMNEKFTGTGLEEHKPLICDLVIKLGSQICSQTSYQYKENHIESEKELTTVK